MDKNVKYITSLSRVEYVRVMKKQDRALFSSNCTFARNSERREFSQAGQ